MVLVLALTIYALLDCARTPEESMPARMPKLIWILLIVLITGVGPIAWIIVSRVKAAEDRNGYVQPTVWSSSDGVKLRHPERPRPIAPDDDPQFLRGLSDDIRRRRQDRGTDPESEGPDSSEAPDSDDD